MNKLKKNVQTPDLEKWLGLGYLSEKVIAGYKIGYICMPYYISFYKLYCHVTLLPGMLYESAIRFQFHCHKVFL